MDRSELKFIRFIFVAYIGVLVFLAHMFFGNIDDELMMLIQWIIIQSGLIVYVATANWCSEKEKILSPAYFIVFAIGCVVSFLYYNATKNLVLPDIANYLILLFIIVVESVMDLVVFNPNKNGGKGSGKETEVFLPYFDTSTNYFDYSSFNHTESEGKTIVNFEVAKLDEFVSKTQRMLDLPEPLKEYFNGDFVKDVAKLKKNKGTIVLKNNFKKFIYLNKDETGEKLLITFIH